MDSLANYGSEDEYENENSRQSADAHARAADHGYREGAAGRHHNTPPQHARKDDDTNYDDVTMDMSESYSDDSSKQECQRRPASPMRTDQRHSHSSGSTDGSSRGKDHRQTDRNSHRRDSYHKDDEHYSRKSPTERASNHSSSDRNSNSSGSSWKRGLLGDKPPDVSSRAGLLGERPSDQPGRPVALMDLKPFGGDPPAVAISLAHDNRQAYGQRSRDGSNRYEREGSDRREKESDREKRHKESDREKSRHGSRGKDKDRKNHSSGDDKKYSSSDRRRDRSRSHEKSSRRKSPSNEKERERDRDRGKRHSGRSGDSSRRSSSHERRHSKRSRSKERSPATSSDYKPSYMVSKKLQAMEKMGLQIKTPDGSMATAQMLMQRSLAEQVEKVKNTTGIELPKYYNPAVINPLKYAEQIQKRKLLWGNKSKVAPPVDAGQSSVSAPVAVAKPGQPNKWQGTKFAEDSDGKVASKFMRLMGIKDPNAVQAAPAQQEPTGDIVKKQEEMFQVMQAQYEVARVTTHTMRGVGLGFPSFNRQY